jgi:hypothetical protein
MYGVPVDIDLSFLPGKRLESAHFSPFQLQLHFDKQVRLSIESVYRIDKAGSVLVYDAIPAGAADVVALLSMDVTNAYRLAKDAVRIEFGDSRALEVVDDSVQYESFQIWNGDAIIVV